jgi:uncharacterized ion transporter superfamily protein YfcC
MRHGKRMQQQNCFTSLVPSARSSTYCRILFFPPSFMSVCSVCLVIYYQGKRKWKAAKELTKNEKTAKTRSKKKKKKKNQIGMRKERDALLLLLFLPSFT